MTLKFCDLAASEAITDQTFAQKVQEIIDDHASDTAPLKDLLWDDPFLDVPGAIRAGTRSLEAGAALAAAGMPLQGRLRVFAGLVTIAAFAQEMAEALGYVAPRPYVEPIPVVREIASTERPDRDDDGDDDDNDATFKPAGVVEINPRTGTLRLDLTLPLPDSLRRSA